MPAKDPIEFRQARGFSDILDATFAFIGQNFKKLGKDLLFIAGPFVLLATFLGLYLQVQSFDFDPQSFNFDTLLSQVPIWGGLFVGALLSMVILLLVFYQYILLYIEKGPEGFQTEEVWRAVKGDFFLLLFTSIGSTIVLVLAMVLLIIPAIYLFVPISLIAIIRLRERSSFFAALSRARQLVKGAWWSTLGLIVVLGIIQSFFSTIIQMPQIVFTFFITFTEGSTGTMAQYPVFTIILGFFSSLGYFTYAISTIGVALQYFSLVEKKEAASLLDKVENLGQDQTE